jgi:putative SOS response-associated peptidase YedK
VTQPIHDRMPVLLPLGHEKVWLPHGGVPFFNNSAADHLIAYPVTPKMNKASFNEPEAIAPLEPAIT